MPPRAAKRPPTTTPLKKKPIPKEEEEHKDNQPDTTISLNNNNNREEDYEEVEEPHHTSSSPAPKEEGEGREEGFVNEIDKSEKLDLEDNYEQFEAEKHVEDDNDGEPEEEEVVEYDEGSMDGDDAMMEGEAEEDAGGDEEIGHDEEGDQEAEEHHDVVKERRKRKEFEVFVGGLDRDATEEDLKEVFSQVGEITQVRLLMNPLTNKNKGFAFLRFATVEQAKRALNELKHPVVNGKQCGVSPSQDSDTLFVGNICKTWTKAALKEKLAHYGVDNFEELTLVEDTGNDGHNRGFAFLDFSSRADALVACRRLQKLDVVFGTDRTAKVAFADSFIEPDDEIMAQVKTVFLDGLPSSWDEERVAEHLKMFGKVEKVELSRNMPAAKRTDFGFITFDTHDAAVACVEGVNSTEFVDGDKKVKVRARLSRPRQRGKSSRHARGGYFVGRGSRGGMLSRYSSVPRTDYWRSGGRGGRGIPSRGPYIGGFKRPLDPRDRYRGTVVAPSRVERRQVPSLQRPISRRSPGIANGRSSSRREFARHGEHYPSSAGFASRTLEERSLSYRDAYTSRRSGYPESPPRSAQRSAPRRPYIEESYERRVERPSSYTDSHSRGYGSLSGSKRPYSSMEEYQSRYTEPTVRESRARIDYRGSAVHSPYNENAYGSESTRSGRGSHHGYDRVSSSSASRSHGLYDTRTSSMGYSRDEVSRGNDGEMYSRYERAYASKDYTTGANVGTTSYSPLYSGRRTGDAYMSGRGSGSYY